MDKKGRVLGQGNTAEIYEWETDKILKLYRQGLPESLCNEEFSITQSIYNQMHVTPKPIEIVYVDNRIGAVYERIHGKTMLKEMLSKPWTFNKYTRLLARCHMNIQKSVDFTLPTVKEKLRWDIEASSLLSDTEKQQIYQYLSTLPDGNILCHFDFHPDNVMLSADKNIIIDWMTACKGDALSDVARTSIILKYSEIPRIPRFINLIFKRMMKKIHGDYLKEYLKITGTQPEKIEAWEMPIAAARLREWIPQREKQILLAYVKRSLSNLPPLSIV